MENLKKTFNEIVQIKNDQDKVILLRKEVPQLYTQLLKQEANIYINKLLNINIHAGRIKDNNLNKLNWQSGNLENYGANIDLFSGVGLIQEIFEKTNNTSKCLIYMQKK